MILEAARHPARTASEEPTVPTRAPEQSPSVNEVHLLGRLAGQPVRRELPSGDVMVSFRLVVPRPRSSRSSRSAGRGGGAGSSRSPTVDTIDCVTFRRDIQRRVERMPDGVRIEVRGALRRRFWRAGGGAVSRSEVEVVQVRRAPGSG